MAKAASDSDPVNLKSLDQLKSVVHAAQRP